MLREYLLDRSPEQVQWSDGMPGVRICQFALSDPWGETLRTYPAQSAPLRFETFFCLGGRLVAEPREAPPRIVEAQSVFLLSDASGLASFRASGSLRGILVSADAAAARDSLRSVCATLGFGLDPRRVRARMDAWQGCQVLTGTPWTQALFGDLSRLAREERGRYCVFKAVELLYLLCTRAPGPDDDRPAGYLCRSIQEARSYMEAHLEEKLTIAALSRRVSLSPTALKTGFRRMYGQPIHQWLMGRRMAQACAMLRDGGPTIQQVAQAVGYDGISQFTTVFKRYYGVTPGQIKKMSETGGPRPFP